MPFENPFFTREMRQTVHRPLPLLVGLLAVAGVQTGFLSLAIHFRSPGHLPPDPVWTGLFLFLHTAGAVAAGGWGASRIFLDEYRRGTLEGLYLLPHSAVSWLLQRLLFPTYLIVLAWCVPLPIYLVGSLAKAVSMPHLERYFWLPAAGGVVASLITLLFPPDVQERMRRMQSGGSGRTRAQDADLTIRILLVAALGLLIQFGVLMLLLRGAGGLPFYLWTVPSWAPIGMVPLLLLPASWITALSAIARQEHLERTAFRTRLAVLGLLYYTDIGVVVGSHWSGVPAWTCVALVLAGPVSIWQMLRRGAPRQEDRRSSMEVARLTQRWGNALLVKDLRVASRFTALTRFALRELLAICISLVGLYYLVVWSGGGSIDDYLNTVTGFALFGAAVLLVVELCARPFATWTRERTAGTLPLLFLTPLSSRTIVTGRLVAALLFVCSVHWPLLLLSVWALARVAVRSPWGVWVGLLGYIPVCGLFWVAFGAAVRPQTEPPWRWRREDWHEVLLGFLFLAVMITALALFNYGSGPPEPAAFFGPLTPFLLVAGLWIVYRTFLIRVAQLDALRCGDWDLREK